MIVRGDMPVGITPVAEVIDRQGRGFALREIDQGEIQLSFDYTVAWITVRAYAVVQAAIFVALARRAFPMAEVSFTAAAGFAHEHLFVPSERAHEAMALLHQVHLGLRMHESALVALLAAGRDEQPGSVPLTSLTPLTREVLAQYVECGAGTDLLPAEAVTLLRRIGMGVPLTAHERTECLVLEGALRDSVRAAALMFEPLTGAVRDARARGIDVTLLDDRDGHALSIVERRMLSDWLGAHLAAFDSGTVTVRLLPVGWEALAVATMDEGSRSTWLELVPLTLEAAAG